MENISSKLTTYTILGLEPGESYKIELGTKTGTVSTRQSIADLILTRNRFYKLYFGSSAILDNVLDGTKLSKFLHLSQNKLLIFNFL
jgi:hypothetical protein